MKIIIFDTPFCFCYTHYGHMPITCLFGGSMAKIFVRERRQVGPGAGLPRFVVVAALGTDLRIFVRHIRKAELEKLAEEAGAEIVYLPRGEHAQEDGDGEQRGRMHGQGRGMGRRRGGHGGGQGTMDQE
jgi:hypothetical protein